MPTFKAPNYSKVVDPKTGQSEPCYTFSIFFTDEEPILSFIAEKKEDISLQTLQNCVIENVPWWNEFIAQFLKATSIFFSKPYTIDNINRIAKHKLTGKDKNTFPSNVSLKPNTIQITGGQFVVNWEYIMESMLIDIPDLDQDHDDTHHTSKLPVSNELLVNGLEELNIDQLPIDKNSTEETLEVQNPAQFYDRQRVKEARLKAKLALYKANRQMAKYYDKYGTNDITDSDSGTESEWGSSDDDEEEEEEVQL
jgi:hypothetical protein